ncbi:MAG: ComF family protein [Pseudomonadota bacterium]
MRILPLISRQLSWLTQGLLPSECLLCAATLKSELLCEGCLYDLPWAQRYQHTCQQCALALTSAADFCGHCLHQPPAFSRSIIPFAYQYPLTPLIHGFKYHRKLTHGKLLGQLLARHIHDCAAQTNWQAPDLLIPVPMHWTRRWQRGFNQAEILGQYLARVTGVQLVTRIIRCRRRSPAQKELTRRARQKNLRKAFFISPAAQQKIIGKRIALIDDVVTTTATMRELSKLLIAAGAKDVQVWALARTMEKS